MPGNFRSGRRPKQIDDRKVIDPDDKPIKPAKMSSAVRAFWDQSITTATHLTKADTVAVRACCDLLEMYLRAMKQSNTQPKDLDLARAARQSWVEWSKSIGQLALDPIGRLRSKNQTRRRSKQDEGPELKFFAQHHG